MTPLSDPTTSSGSLMRAFVKNGDPDAFRDLVARFLPLVLGAALRRSQGDRALAEDIAQLVFADFAKRMPQLRADDRIATSSTSAAASSSTATGFSSLISLPIAGLGALIALGIGTLPLLGGRDEKQPPATAARDVTPAVQRPSLRPLTAIIERNEPSLEEIVAALGELFSRPLTSLDRIRVAELLARIRKDQAGRALALMDRDWTPLMLARIDVEDRRTNLFMQWGKREPEAALEWLLAKLTPGSGASFRAPQSWSMAWHLTFSRWGFENRDKAWAWTQERMESGGFETVKNADLTPVLSQVFGPGLIDQLGKLPGAEALFDLQEVSPNPNYQTAMASILERIESTDEFTSLMELLDRRLTAPEARVNGFATDPEQHEPEGWRTQARRLVRDVAQRTGRDLQTFTLTSISGVFANDTETRERMRQFLAEGSVEEEEAAP